MDFVFFATSMAELCAHAHVAEGRDLRWTIIANPKAGGFTIGRRWRRHEHAIRSALAQAAALPPRSGKPSRTAVEHGDPSLGVHGLMLTSGPGHAGKITELLIDEIRSEAGTRRPFHLIITAGGDGTSLEVLTSLYYAPPETLSHCAVLRLPMGTGNDGADSWELAGGLNLLLNETKIGRARALRLVTSNSEKGVFLAFNILSVGLDAFVTHMTNKMKGKMPGDSYKLWVDIAALLYDRIYHVGNMDVYYTPPVVPGGKRQAVPTHFREKLLLLAVGASGHRTYGSHKIIVPDSRNVCALRQMPLLRKLALKDLFAKGTHVDKPEAILFNAERVEFRGEYPFLAQMDGETVLLEKPDFPAAIEVTDPLIPILRANGGEGK